MVQKIAGNVLSGSVLIAAADSIVLDEGYGFGRNVSHHAKHTIQYLVNHQNVYGHAILRLAERGTRARG